MSVFSTDGKGTLVGVVLLNDEQADLYQESLAFQNILQLSNRQVTVGAVPVVPPLSQTLLLFAQTTSEDVVLDDYPFEALYTVLDVAPTIYTLSPSGSVAFSGTAPLSFTAGVAGTTYTISPSGGVAFSGAVAQIRTRTQSISGSVVFSGAAAVIRSRLYTPSGAVVFSGSSSQIHTRVEPVSGQVAFSGSAPISFTSGAGAGGANQRTLVGVGI